MSRVVSTHQPERHFKWGADCDGWTLVDNETFSIKQERMPPGTSELNHYHEKAQQFFFILNGVATFEISETFSKAHAGEGVLIKAGEPHRISNEGTEALEFILYSQPPTSADRINLEL